MIPKFVAEWISAQRDIGYTLQQTFYQVHWADKDNDMGKEQEWVASNGELFARAWLDGYTVEEQKYFAKIKGHENIGSDDKYWNYCITDESLDIGDNKVHADVLAEYVLNATKDEWENLGINDDNADFEEMEE